MSDTGPHMSLRLVQPFLRLLRERGVRIEAPFLGPDRQALDDPDARIPHQLAIDLLELTVRGLKEPALGLLAAEKVEPGDFDVLEYAGLSSDTLGEAIGSANRYLRLMHDAADFELERRGDEAVWRFRMLAGLQLPAAAAEFMVASLVIVGRRFTESALPTTAVGFAHPRPADTTVHQRIFQGSLAFDQPETALVMPAEVLELAMPRADPGLKAILERTARQLLERLPRHDSWGARARELLAAELPRGTPTLEQVAYRLGVTSRTLRRRLTEEGVSHQQLLDEVRLTLAQRHLRQRVLSISEIAFLLGFSEPSAFHRAFRRWTGTAPAEYRRG